MSQKSTQVTQHIQLIGIQVNGSYGTTNYNNQGHVQQVHNNAVSDKTSQPTQIIGTQVNEGTRNTNYATNYNNVNNPIHHNAEAHHNNYNPSTPEPTSRTSQTPQTYPKRCNRNIKTKIESFLTRNNNNNTPKTKGNAESESDDIRNIDEDIVMDNHDDDDNPNTLRPSISSVKSTTASSQSSHVNQNENNDKDGKLEITDNDEDDTSINSNSRNNIHCDRDGSNSFNNNNSLTQHCQQSNQMDINSNINNSDDSDLNMYEISYDNNINNNNKSKNFGCCNGVGDNLDKSEIIQCQNICKKLFHYDCLISKFGFSENIIDNIIYDNDKFNCPKCTRHGELQKPEENLDTLQELNQTNEHSEISHSETEETFENSNQGGRVTIINNYYSIVNGNQTAATGGTILITTGNKNGIQVNNAGSSMNSLLNSNNHSFNVSVSPNSPLSRILHNIPGFRGRSNMSNISNLSNDQNHRYDRSKASGPSSPVKTKRFDPIGKACHENINNNKKLKGRNLINNSNEGGENSDGNNNCGNESDGSTTVLLKEIRNNDWNNENINNKSNNLNEKEKEENRDMKVDNNNNNNNNNNCKDKMETTPGTMNLNGSDENIEPITKLLIYLNGLDENELKQFLECEDKGAWIRDNNVGMDVEGLFIQNPIDFIEAKPGINPREAVYKINPREFTNISKNVNNITIKNKMDLVELNIECELLLLFYDKCWLCDKYLGNNILRFSTVSVVATSWPVLAAVNKILDKHLNNGKE